MRPRAIGRLLKATMALALTIGVSTATGCYGPSAEDPSGVHQPSVTPETYTEVRDAIDEAGYSTERGGRLLMYRQEDDRVRVEGEFVSSEGDRETVLVLEQRDGTWEIVEGDGTR